MIAAPPLTAAPEIAQVELTGRELDLIIANMQRTPHYHRTPETLRLTNDLAVIRASFQGEIRPRV
jgi:hypothetical protein